ncbi:MAG: hypothetical protein JO146_09055, partial [Candidatus Eremiobacteraeota bacterium]|nr:hypothetical protein [Candidatus Eremiobacteraeota bacterium]
MARANPARSPYAATRHLLKNLRNVRELRRNPLVRDEFASNNIDEAQRAIAARVDAALPVQNACHVAILLRVDAERHDRRSVATDLGLSTRQFYRERRRAHEAFYAAYRANARQGATVEEGFARQLLTRAASLADSGETASAVAISHDVLSSGGEPAITCEALLRLAETHIWSHRFERARAELADCAAILTRDEMQADRAAAMRDHAQALALLLEWFSNGPAAVALPSNGYAARGYRTSFVVAAGALRRGETQKAAASLRELTSLEQSAAADVAVDLLTLRAEFANFTAAHPSIAEALFARAAALADEHGLRGRAFFAHHQLLLTRWLRSRSVEDRRAYREFVDAASPSFPARVRSFLSFAAADIEVTIGDPRRSLKAARAAASLATNRLESLSAQGLVAGSLLRLGRFSDAAVEAAHAAERARSEGYARVIPIAQRVCAHA